MLCHFIKNTDVHDSYTWSNVREGPVTIIIAIIIYISNYIIRLVVW